MIQRIIADEIAAFKKEEDNMIARYMGKFVVFHEGVFINSFDTFDAAAKAVFKLRLTEPFLIRQVQPKNKPPMIMPSWEAFHARAGG